MTDYQSAITFCDNCGCNWLDDGLNPIGCPYCKLTALSAEIEALTNALQEVVDAADGDGWKVLDPSLEKQRAALAAMKNPRAKS